MAELYELAERAATQEQLAEFVRALNDDFSDDPDDWANHDIPSFLEAMARLLESGVRYSLHVEGANANLYRVIATLLMHSSRYE